MRPTAKLLPVVSVLAQTIMGGAAPWCLAMSATLGLVQPAIGDVKAVEPYVVAVIKDDSAMKCLGGSPYYAVATLKTGQLLRVDGEEGGWLRAEYLPGMLAFVKVLEVAEADPESKAVRLIKDSRLGALNAAASDRGHWWPLLDTALGAGTTFQVSQTVKGIDGRVQGYLVAAPAAARGYVKADAVRKATEQEIAMFDSSRREAALAAGKQESDGAKLEADAGETKTTATQSVASLPAGVAGTIYDFETLKGRFDAAMGKAGNEAQIATVIADFTRKIWALGNSAEDQRVRASLDQGLKALRLRRDVLAAIKRVQSAEVAAAGDFNK